MQTGGMYRIVLGAGVILLFLMIPVSTFCAAITDPNPVLRTGDLFPKVSFLHRLSPEERAYLSIGEKKDFSIEEIKSDLAVIKLLNTNCVYCIKLLPAFNEIFRIIEQDRELKTKIKMIGISTGDTKTETEEFKKKHLIPYPTFPDTDFKVHKAVGEPRVPFIVVARKDRQGQWVVAMVNVGLIFSAESFVGELKAILAVDPETLKLKRAP